MVGVYKGLIKTCLFSHFVVCALIAKGEEPDPHVLIIQAREHADEMADKVFKFVADLERLEKAYEAGGLSGTEFFSRYEELQKSQIGEPGSKKLGDLTDQARTDPKEISMRLNPFNPLPYYALIVAGGSALSIVEMAGGYYLVPKPLIHDQSGTHYLLWGATSFVINVIGMDSFFEKIVPAFLKMRSIAEGRKGVPTINQVEKAFRERLKERGLVVNSEFALEIAHWDFGENNSETEEMVHKLADLVSKNIPKNAPEQKALARMKQPATGSNSHKKANLIEIISKYDLIKKFSPSLVLKAGTKLFNGECISILRDALTLKDSPRF